MSVPDGLCNLNSGISKVIRRAVRSEHWADDKRLEVGQGRAETERSRPVISALRRSETLIARDVHSVRGGGRGVQGRAGACRGVCGLRWVAPAALEKHCGADKGSRRAFDPSEGLTREGCRYYM